MSRYKGKYYSPKRRALYARGDEIDHVTLFNLHGWVCNICKGSINPNERFPSLRAATVEHVIPLSLGGTHTWDNCAAAHADCNFKKSNSLNIVNWSFNRICCTMGA